MQQSGFSRVDRKLGDVSFCLWLLVTSDCLHRGKQLAAMRDGDQDWRRAAFGASLVHKPARAHRPAGRDDGHKV